MSKIELVQDIPDNYTANYVDMDIQDILDYIGYNGKESFTVLFVLVENADYTKVYGCYGTPYLDSYVVELL